MSSSESQKGEQYSRVDVQTLLNHEDFYHTGDRSSCSQVKCDYVGCGRLFVSPRSLSMHRKRQHCSPTSNVCPKCLSSFSTVPNLNRHVSSIFISSSSIFKGYMSVKCLTFPKFRSVHEKKKRFVCGKCTASFSFRDGLDRHVQMVHYDMRPYPCVYCSVAFKTMSHRNKHILSKHPQDPKHVNPKW